MGPASIGRGLSHHSVVWMRPHPSEVLHVSVSKGREVLCDWVDEQLVCPDEDEASWAELRSSRGFSET